MSIATKAAYEFVKLIRWLKISGVPYFVAWGYEGLPDNHSGGDIDLYVHPDYYGKVAETLNARGYKSAPCPYKHQHAQFGRTGYYTIHLFSSLCFKLGTSIRHTTISPDELLANRRQHGEIFVASPLVETFFSLLRYVSGRKDPQIIERIMKSSETLE